MYGQVRLGFATPLLDGWTLLELSALHCALVTALLH
jgi:hypothetical protein